MTIGCVKLSTIKKLRILDQSMVHKELAIDKNFIKLSNNALFLIMTISLAI